MKIKRQLFAYELPNKRTVDKDTVFTVINERELFDEDGTQIGWVYDEILENKDKFIERIAKENYELSGAVMELTTALHQSKVEMDKVTMDLTNLIMGGM